MSSYPFLCLLVPGLVLFPVNDLPQKHTKKEILKKVKNFFTLANSGGVSL
jgi:hypothetical protein